MTHPDPNFIPPKCKRCSGTGVDPDQSYSDGFPEDPTPCIHCLGNGVLHPEAEYSDRTGKLIGYNYPKIGSEELYNADPNCEHNIVGATYGGGVKCTKCKGWFCY